LQDQVDSLRERLEEAHSRLEDASEAIAEGLGFRPDGADSNGPEIDDDETMDDED
jgi:hypothetical protein